MEIDHPDHPWTWQGDGTDDLATFCADTKILITADQIRALLMGEAKAAEVPLLAIIETTNDDLRLLLDRVPECRGGGENTIVTDNVGHVIFGEIGDAPSDMLLSNIALTRVSAWIEELDLALGQLRSFARTGELGTDRLTVQDSRLYERGLVPEGPTLPPMPDDALVDVLAEIGRLGQLATRRRSEP